MARRTRSRRKPTLSCSPIYARLHQGGDPRYDFRIRAAQFEFPHDVLSVRLDDTQARLWATIHCIKMENIDGARLLEDPGVEHFKGGSTFGALSTESVAFLLSKGRILSLSDGEELFHAGEPGNCFFVVLQGLLDYLHEWEKEQVLIRTATFGETVGYVTMIGLFDRIGIARSRGPSLLLEVSSDLFHQVHIDYPFDFGILMLNLTRNMARTIHALTTQYAAVCIGHSIP